MQVSDTYDSVSSSDRSAEERKASVRALQQQYSNMSPPTNGPLLNKQNSFRASKQ